jgi:hypothetical protein
LGTAPEVGAVQVRDTLGPCTDEPTAAFWLTETACRPVDGRLRLVLSWMVWPQHTDARARRAVKRNFFIVFLSAFAGFLNSE